MQALRAYGSLVKWLRRRPLKAESGVQFSYELLLKAAGLLTGRFFFIRDQAMCKCPSCRTFKALLQN